MLLPKRAITHSARLRTIWAATTVLCNVAASASSASSASSSQSCSTNANANTIMTVPSYPLIDKWQQSHDSWLLRFSLPTDQKHLGNDPTLPTCISVHHNSSLDNGKILKKSYSPVSHPGTVGTFDLLVKAYTPQPGGGVGHGICHMKPGQSTLIGKLKKERLVHGSPIISKRWDRIGLIAGGTGVAPLVQIIRIVLDNPEDNTKISVLSINRNEEDILMKEELDALANQHPDRFSVKYSLTGNKIREDWDGYRGRGSVEMVKAALPPPSSSDGKSTMIFICGTDGFRDMWGGPIARAPPLADGSKGPKIQGPLLGVLKDGGYDASDVFKY